MLNIDDYYIGLIIAHPSYYTNPKSIRKIADISFDPFIPVSKEVAITLGVTTLLKRKEDTYYDEYNSRWENELAYHLRETNELGITLAYIKPFKECYSEEITTYIEEDMNNDYKMLEEAFSNHSYYILHSKITKKDAIVIVEEDPMRIVQNEYLYDLLGPEQYNDFWEKTLKK